MTRYWLTQAIELTMILRGPTRIEYNNQYLGELHMAGGAKSRTSQAKDMGSQGGKAGGPARAQKLTQAQRSEIARKGANAKNNKSKGK